MGDWVLEVDFSLPAERVIRSLEQIIEWRGKPDVIRCDNGPEYISGALQTWTEKRYIHLEYIHPASRSRMPMSSLTTELYATTGWHSLFESIAEVQDRTM
jgi:putative transposase